MMCSNILSASRPSSRTLNESSSTAIVDWICPLISIRLNQIGNIWLFLTEHIPFHFCHRLFFPISSGIHCQLIKTISSTIPDQTCHAPIFLSKLKGRKTIKIIEQNISQDKIRQEFKTSILSFILFTTVMFIFWNCPSWLAKHNN